jgi:hypothetical protein
MFLQLEQQEAYLREATQGRVCDQETGGYDHSNVCKSECERTIEKHSRPKN